MIKKLLCMDVKKYIGLWILGLLVLMGLLYGLWHNQLDAREVTSYSVDEVTYTTQEIQHTTITNKANVKTWNLHRYEIAIGEQNTLEGNIKAVVSDQVGHELIYEGNATDYLQNGYLVFEVSKLDFTSSKELTMQLTFDLEQPIQVDVKEDGNLKDAFVYGYYYAGTLKWCCLGIIAIYFLIGLIGIISKLKLEHAMLIMILVFGLIALFLVPPFAAPDEFRHFARAYDISSGHLTIQEVETRAEFLGGRTMQVVEIPQDIFDLKLLTETNSKSFVDEMNNGTICIPAYLEALSKAPSNETTMVAAYGTAQISPLAYLPQVVALFIGRLLGVRGIWLYYVSRLGNLLVAAVLSWWAVRKISHYKEIMYVIAMIPTILFLRVTNSTDGFLLGIVFVLMAEMLELRESKRQLAIKDYVIISVCILFMSLIKAPYILMVGLLATLDKQQFQGKNLYKYGVIILEIAVGAGIYLISTQMLADSASTVSTSAESSVSILGYFMSHMASQIVLLMNTFLDGVITSFFASFGWPTGITVAGWSMLMYVVTVIGTKEGRRQNVRLRITAIVIAVFAWAAVIMVFYLVSSPGSGYIGGIQSRYMIPLFPILAIGLAPGVEWKKDYRKYLIVCTGMLSCWYMFTLIGTYWA